MSTNRLGSPPSRRKQPESDLPWQERVRLASEIMVTSLWRKYASDPDKLLAEVIGFAREALIDLPTDAIVRTGRDIGVTDPSLSGEDMLSGAGVFRLALGDHGWQHEPRAAESFMVIVQRAARDRIEALQAGG